MAGCKSPSTGATPGRRSCPVARSLYFPFLVDPISSHVVVATSSPTFGATPLQESLDGGATWIDLSSAIPGFPSINAFAIASYQGNRPDGTYQFDPAFPLVGDKGANTYDPDTIYIANGGSQLLVTKDHAQSWVDRTPNLPGIGAIVDVTVDPRNRDTVYVVTQGVPGSGANRVLKSTDARPDLDRHHQQHGRYSRSLDRHSTLEGRHRSARRHALSR